ncbi:hypothetical protein [Frankia sp. Cas4]|uniref:hypothetical protein n=1 Tax=Frankia sp. Cas4 TaxID=3073927 RepID=UPI002AD21576|nr:hypothetical protein [Frankia sp. Cas4]
MPALLYARVPRDAAEEKKIRRLAGARHTPAGWIPYRYPVLFTARRLTGADQLAGGTGSRDATFVLSQR